MKRCPYCAEEIQDAAVKCKHCGEMLPGTGRNGSGNRPLTRSRTDKILAGVCSGLATYSGMDVTIIRLLTALAILVTGIIPGLIMYLIAALIIPEEGSR